MLIGKFMPNVCYKEPQNSISNIFSVVDFYFELKCKNF